VDIVILNWNGRRDTLACLRSLSKIDYPAFRIVVVDNGSTDGSASDIGARHPRCTLIENRENLGYSGGNNVGMARSLKDDAEYVLLLNNDTEVKPNFLRILVETIESDPRIGVAGPLIYYHEQPQRVWSAGAAVKWPAQVRMIGVDTVDHGQFAGNYREVDMVSGCAMLVRRTVLEKIGLLDERFFCYFEDAEWCFRARRSGFRIVTVPDAKVWHKIPIDCRESDPMVHYYMTRNRLLFLKTTRLVPLTWLYTIFTEYLRTLASWSLRPKWRHKKEHRKMMLRAILDALWGRWGIYSLRDSR